MLAVRGATAIDYDTPEHVADRVVELYEKLRETNRIDRLIAVTFSVTPDIRSANPATILRRKFQLSEVAFMCVQEAMFEDSPHGIIRVLLLFQGEGQNFVYLHQASQLRADLNVD